MQQTLGKTLSSHCKGLRRVDERQLRALCMCGLSLGAQLASTHPTLSLRARDALSAHPAPPDEPSSYQGKHHG